ncbi:Adaptive-response sensory-kinase SasA [Usitatibacter rugosus]|uniref:histidine kinase n=1 Tax=Usitatibacter rugosus TaxID=2732067 RepID=A0A6M4GXD0_9PROT|nr:HAMP domain-containing sensor histidine kinase [Usitatibacter rugosus]QJR11949.1 Adaptive-response sensory-kinase SasA [Usitatibacter rugosus]
MLYEFLESHRSELIERCRTKASRRTAPLATQPEMELGIPLFLEQLIETLRIVQTGPERTTTGDPIRDLRSEITSGATTRGSDAFRHGYTVNQVVHGYGDLCQSITEIAGERHAPVSTSEFQTLNKCLDDAIADAVTEYARQRDTMVTERSDVATGERLGFLAHELRNFLNTAMLAFAAIKSGSVSIDGATAAVLDRSFTGLRDLVDHALTDVRLASGRPVQTLETIAVDGLISDVQVAASLEARTRGCHFAVYPVSRELQIQGDRQMLGSALSNLLQNAFKFTRLHSHVSLKAYTSGGRVLIEIEDQCGGLPKGKAESMFSSFEQNHADRSGLGLGLSIARRAIEAVDGVLRVRDMPGLGCVFTVDLPSFAPNPA